MEGSVYTLGVWRVKPGREADFIAAWKDLGTLFAKLPMPPGGRGTLVQSITDPLLFYSFGEWPSTQAVQAMRQDTGAQAGIRRAADLCTEATPGSFRVVAEA